MNQKTNWLASNEEGSELVGFWRCWKIRAMLAMPIAVGIAIVAVLSFATPASAIFASCEVECAQWKSVCIAQASLDASWAMAECNYGAAQRKLGCQQLAVEARGSCVGLCGTDRTSCTMADQKPCADTWKEEFRTCTAGATQGLKDNKASCAAEYADCVLYCAGD